MLFITVGYSSSTLWSMIFGTLVSMGVELFVSLHSVHYTTACGLEMEMTYKNFNHTDLRMHSATWNIQADSEWKHSNYIQCLNKSYSYEKGVLMLLRQRKDSIMHTDIHIF
jgi:hypothetical protein